jgi:hypothetical protein
MYTQLSHGRVLAWLRVATFIQLAHSTHVLMQNLSNTFTKVSIVSVIDTLNTIGRDFSKHLRILIAHVTVYLRATLQSHSSWNSRFV